MNLVTHGPLFKMFIYIKDIIPYCNNIMYNVFITFNACSSFMWHFVKNPLILMFHVNYLHAITCIIYMHMSRKNPWTDSQTCGLMSNVTYIGHAPANSTIHIVRGNSKKVVHATCELHVQMYFLICLTLS